MAADILDKITSQRRERLQAEGPAQGLNLPQSRPPSLPRQQFPGPIICEVKRRSPSRGALAAGLDPVVQAETYRTHGASSVSVLTEQDHFHGALGDLIAIKRAFPDLAVLRKDFLLNAEDVRVSWRAGADAVLLIAAILGTDELGRLVEVAESLGMAALVEVHDEVELERVRPVRPRLVGMNSRDLRTFRVDTLRPVALIRSIDWECDVVFESGVFYPEDVLTARDAGFRSVLVGEAVVRNPSIVSALAEPMIARWNVQSQAAAPAAFWNYIAGRLALRAAVDAGPLARRPLVKICGITNVDDALLAQELGADLIGLIYAESKRTAPAGLAAALHEAGVTVPLVGVVVEPSSPAELDRAPADDAAAQLTRRARRDLADGALAALQLHGRADPAGALKFGHPYYQALRPARPDEARAAIAASRSVRVLVDGRHPTLPGGSGTPVDPAVLEAVTGALAQRPHGELWLAGGLGPHNIASVIQTYEPELVDASSGLEAAPGHKSRERLTQYFAEIERVTAPRRALLEEAR